MTHIKDSGELHEELGTIVSVWYENAQDYAQLLADDEEVRLVIELGEGKQVERMVTKENLLYLLMGVTLCDNEHFSYFVMPE